MVGGGRSGGEEVSQARRALQIVKRRLEVTPNKRGASLGLELGRDVVRLEWAREEADMNDGGAPCSG